MCVSTIEKDKMDKDRHELKYPLQIESNLVLYATDEGRQNRELSIELKLNQAANPMSNCNATALSCSSLHISPPPIIIIIPH